MIYHVHLSTKINRLEIVKYFCSPLYFSVICIFHNLKRCVSVSLYIDLNTYTSLQHLPIICKCNEPVRIRVSTILIFHVTTGTK